MRLNRREFLKVAGVSGLSLAAGNWLAAADATAQTRPSAVAASGRPNLLYIFTDQQFAGAMSCAGNPWVKTPNMDSLAASGARFNLAYTPHPLCSPARASMLTGLMPHQTGVTGNCLSIREELQQQEMGWVFRQGGYRTVYAGKAHVPEVNKLEPSHGFEVLPGIGDGPVSESCAEFLLRKQDKPFLLVAALVEPHDICGAVKFAESDLKPEALTGKILKRFPPLLPNFEPPTPVPGAATRCQTGTWSAEHWRRYLYSYFSYVNMADRSVGQLLEALRKSGQEENTVIIFSSDHGDGMGAHHTSGKNLFYEEMARVPFIVSHKGRTVPGKVDQEHLVSTGLDLMPTLCDYAGIALPRGLKGRSVRGLAEGQTPADWRDQVIGQCGGGGVQGVNVPGRMVRSGRFKYTAYENPKTPLEELFDLHADPGERNNLAGQSEFKTVLSEHRERLARWCKENCDSAWSGG